MGLGEDGVEVIEFFKKVQRNGGGGCGQIRCGVVEEKMLVRRGGGVELWDFIIGVRLIWGRFG